LERGVKRKEELIESEGGEHKLTYLKVGVMKEGAVVVDRRSSSEQTFEET
jgi:hypothetical protein